MTTGYRLGGVDPGRMAQVAPRRVKAVRSPSPAPDVSLRPDAGH
jgi:hypothetical protein